MADTDDWRINTYRKEYQFWVWKILNSINFKRKMVFDSFSSYCICDNDILAHYFQYSSSLVMYFIKIVNKIL